MGTAATADSQVASGAVAVWALLRLETALFACLSLLIGSLFVGQKRGFGALLWPAYVVAALR